MVVLSQSEIDKIISKQRQTRTVNEAQKKVFNAVTSAKSAYDAFKIQEQVRAINPNLTTRNEVLRGGKVIESKGVLGIGSGEIKPFESALTPRGNIEIVQESRVKSRTENLPSAKDQLLVTQQTEPQTFSSVSLGMGVNIEDKPVVFLDNNYNTLEELQEMLNFQEKELSTFIISQSNAQKNVDTFPKHETKWAIGLAQTNQSVYETRKKINDIKSRITMLRELEQKEKKEIMPKLDSNGLIVPLALSGLLGYFLLRKKRK